MINNEELLQILSLYVGLVNVSENRQQSAQNDVQSANDKQAQYLLTEIDRKFNEQNEMLRKILKDLEESKK